VASPRHGVIPFPKPLPPLYLDHFPIRANHQPQLTALVVSKDPSPQRLRKELVGGIVTVDEVPDLSVCHAAASFLAQIHLLIQPPLVDVLQVLGVDVDEGVELIGYLVV
jgi:hypothetical protein